MLLFNVDTIIINYRANYMPQNQQSAILQASKHLTMDEHNTACTLSKIRATLGEEPTISSKQILKLNYVICYTKRFEMDSYHTTKAKQNCCEIFSEALGNEPAKYLLKSSFVGWYTKHFSLEALYVDWFCSKNNMDSANTQTLQSFYRDIFEETLQNIQKINTLSSGSFTSSDVDVRTYAQEMIARKIPVAAGDASFEEWYSASDREKNDAVTKELLTGCLNGLLPPYIGADYITAGIIAWGVKDGVLSALKGLAIEGVIMCGGGIIDRATDNLMKCGDLVCDYKSNDSWDKDTRDNTIC